MPAFERVQEALVELPCEVAGATAGRWQLALPGHAPIRAQLVEGERWLCLQAAPRAGDLLCNEPAPALLERGARLGGLAKIALGGGDDVVHVRAELPLDVTGALAPRLRATVAGMSTALGSEPAAAWLDVRATATQSEQAVSADDLEGLCRATGVTVLARHPRFLALDLGLDDVAARVRVATAPSDAASIRAWAELATLPAPLSEACDQALARFLLEVAASVCMVRPFVARTPVGAHLQIGFEVRLAAAACARELGHALSALGVAARMSGREAQVLGRDETSATTYLALREQASARGRAPRSTPTLHG